MYAYILYVFSSITNYESKKLEINIHISIIKKKGSDLIIYDLKNIIHVPGFLYSYSFTPCIFDENINFDRDEAP